MSETDRVRGPTEDFVLYIRDKLIDKPVCLMDRNEFNELALMVSLMPDFKNVEI